MADFARVGVQVDVSGPKRASKIFKQIVEEETRKMAKEIAEFGELEMKSNIYASGTAFSQRARQAGINKGPGRYRTGKMYNSVTSRVEAGAKQIRAAFGWINTFENYFRYQEEGFRNRWVANYNPSGGLIVNSGQPSVRLNPYGGYKNTKGMFALRDARLSVVRELPRFQRKYAGIIARRLRATNK